MEYLFLRILNKHNSYIFAGIVVGVKCSTHSDKKKEKSITRISPVYSQQRNDENGIWLPNDDNKNFGESF